MSRHFAKLRIAFLGFVLMELVSCQSARDQMEQYSEKWIGQFFRRWEAFELKDIKRPERRFYAGESQAKVLGTTAGLAIGFMILAYFGGKYWEKYSLRRKQRKQTLRKVEQLYEQFKITENDDQLLVRLCGTASPDTLLKMLESAEEFELYAKEFAKIEQDDKTLSHLYRLRHQLGFGFYSKRIPFLCTQMLSPSDRIECTIVLPKKTVTFLSSIIFATEKYLVIKSPTRHKKPVDLMRFSSLLCKVSRDDAVEYQFTLPIRRELRGKVNGIVLNQSREIQTLLVRDAERVPVNITTTFYAITEKEITLYIDQTRYLSTVKHIPHFKGVITDISTGGINVAAAKLPRNLEEDALLVFSIEAAKIRGDLAARILMIEDSEGGHHLHLQFFRLREIKRIRLNKFIEQMKRRTVQ